MNVKIFALAACIVAGLPVAKAEYRKFSNTEGQTITAELIRYDDVQKEITLRCKGKGIKTVPISIFSKKDQQYIVSWQQCQDFLSEKTLTVEIDEDISKKKDYCIEDDWIAENYFDCCYHIKIENNSPVDFNVVELEYVVFYTQERHIHNRNDKEELSGTLYDSKTISLPHKSTVEVATENIVLFTYWMSSDDSVAPPKLDSEINGVILKLSMKPEIGRRITRQIKYPEGIMYGWRDSTRNVQKRLPR